MSPTQPKVAFIHATWAAAEPITAAVRQELPDAVLWHLLDDRLQEDALTDGMSTTLHERMLHLIDHAVSGGADAVQLTCSMYASVVATARQRWDLPIFGPDEALQQAVREYDAQEVRLLFSWPQACADGTQRMKDAVAPTALVVRGVVAEGAATAVADRDEQRLLEALADAAGDREDGVVIALGQYSLSPVSAVLAQRLDMPVLTGPALAAQQLRRSLDSRPATVTSL